MVPSVFFFFVFLSRLEVIWGNFKNGSNFGEISNFGSLTKEPPHLVQEMCTQIIENFS